MWRTYYIPQGSPETDMNNSMYDEMIDILKDIEKEDINGQTKRNFFVAIIIKYA